MRTCHWPIVSRLRRARGVAMLEYTLILIFMSVMMVVITWVVLRLLPDYYRVLLSTLISATV